MCFTCFEFFCFAYFALFHMCGSCSGAFYSRFRSFRNTPLREGLAAHSSYLVLFSCLFVVLRRYWYGVVRSRLLAYLANVLTFFALRPLLLVLGCVTACRSYVVRHMQMRTD